jgi:hypothetical protein
LKPVAAPLAEFLGVDQAPPDLDDVVDGSLSERADDLRLELKAPRANRESEDQGQFFQLLENRPS